MQPAEQKEQGTTTTGSPKKSQQERRFAEGFTPYVTKINIINYNKRSPLAPECPLMSRGIRMWHSQLSSHHFCTAPNSTQHQFSLPAMTFFMQLVPHHPLLNTALGEEDEGKKEFPIKKSQIENVKLKVFPKMLWNFLTSQCFDLSRFLPLFSPFLFQMKKWPGEESDRQNSGNQREIAFYAQEPWQISVVKSLQT